MRNEVALRQKIVGIGQSIFQRGLTAGSSGNLSARLDDGYLISPTNTSLSELKADRLSKISFVGVHISGDQPSKELHLHRAMYDKRPNDEGIVHLHSTYSAAVSCMAGLDRENCIPPLTAYYVMKIHRLPLIPYFRPGDMALAETVCQQAQDHHAVLLAHHGPLVSGSSLDTALHAIEELEETAKIFLLLHDKKYSILTQDQISELETVFQLNHKKAE